MVLVVRPASRRHRTAPASVVVAVLALLIVIGRLGGPIASFAATLAPFACSVCHGCPVASHHDVCDCSACNDVIAGRASGAPSLHDPGHAGAKGETGDQDLASSFRSPLPLLPFAHARVLDVPRTPRPMSHGPDAPDPPPPRRARA